MWNMKNNLCLIINLQRQCPGTGRTDMFHIILMAVRAQYFSTNWAMLFIPQLLVLILWLMSACTTLCQNTNHFLSMNEKHLITESSPYLESVEKICKEVFQTTDLWNPFFGAKCDHTLMRVWSALILASTLGWINWNYMHKSLRISCTKTGTVQLSTQQPSYPSDNYI